MWYDLDGHFNMLHLVCLLEVHIHQAMIVYSWGLGHGWSIFWILIYVGIDIPEILSTWNASS